MYGASCSYTSYPSKQESVMGYTGFITAIGLLMVIGCTPQTPEEKWERGAARAVQKLSHERDLTRDQQVLLAGIAEEVKANRGYVESLKDGLTDLLAEEPGTKSSMPGR